MNKKLLELTEDVTQLKNELDWVVSLMGQRMSMLNLLEEELTNLDFRRNDINLQLIEAQYDLNEALAAQGATQNIKGDN